MFVRLSAAIAALSLLSSAAMAQAAKPTDPQIAHIAYTAGVIDIDAAKQALGKASTKEVKAFAQDMVRDHEVVNKRRSTSSRSSRSRPRTMTHDAPARKGQGHSEGNGAMAAVKALHLPI